MQAFGGQDTLKQETIRRVSGHMQAGELLPGSRAWDASTGKGSAGGCAVHSADLAVCERELGVPQTLVAMVEAIYGQMWMALRELETRAPGWVAPADASAARSFPTDWLEAISPGADLRPIARQFTVWLLADPEHGAVAHTRHVRVGEVLRAVAKAHGGGESGKAEAVNWASLRALAVRLRDEWPEATESIDAWAASVAETACWPFTPDSQRLAEETLQVYFRCAECKAAVLVVRRPEDLERSAALHAQVQRAVEEAVPRSARDSMDREALMAAVSKVVEPYQERLQADQEWQAPHVLEVFKQRWLLARACREALLRVLAGTRSR